MVLIGNEKEGKTICERSEPGLSTIAMTQKFGTEDSMSYLITKSGLEVTEEWIYLSKTGPDELNSCEGSHNPVFLLILILTDCNIPKEWPENKSLGAWVSTQRKGYKAMLAGERSSMTPERQMALDSIGFTWNLRPARTRPKILEIGGLQNPGISQV